MKTYIKVICGLRHHAVVAANGKYAHFRRPCVKETFCDADYPRPLYGDTNQPSKLYINVV